MIRFHLQSLFAAMRKSVCLVVLGLIWLPGTSASAQLLWGSLPTQCPLDAAPQSQQLAPLSSESLATLQEWLNQESQATTGELATGAIMPCGAPTPGEPPAPGVCINTKSPSDRAQKIPKTPRFVAASLTQDVAPLIPLEAPGNSCVWDSEDPQRCESSPFTPIRLHLEATLGQAWVPTPLTLVHPVQRVFTLALLKANPHRLVGPARGHPDLLVPPPQHA